VTPAGAKLHKLCNDVIRDLSEKEKMSHLDKMALLRQRRDDFNKSLDARAQTLLDRYAEADKKADQAFDRHKLQLDAEETELNEVELAIDRMSNSGNSPSSEKSFADGGADVGKS
jgi:predicted metallo-beta-lactamase superfamily hydrolase